MTKYKKALKQLWHFIWYDDSIWSWLVNIVLAFILIKFIVYPGLGFALGTPYPIVAVVSGSMEHDGNFDTWWTSETAICSSKKCSQQEYYGKYNISKDAFLGYRFSNGFNKGDIMILRGAKQDKIAMGDVLVYRVNRPDPIIHRVIKVEKDSYQTKGDHNQASIGEYGMADFDETVVEYSQVVGKAWIRVPWLGWVKIGFVKLIDLFV